MGPTVSPPRSAAQPPQIKNPVKQKKFFFLYAPVLGLCVPDGARGPPVLGPNGSSSEVGLLAATIKQPVSSIPVFCVRVKDSYPDTCALRSSSRESLRTKPLPASNNSPHWERFALYAFYA